jgi:cytochrome P450
LTDNQITDNVLLLLLAGHDTSSTTLTKCFSNLQDHPAVMDKLRAEQRVLVAKHGEAITPAVLKDMMYADAVIRWVVGVGPGGPCCQDWCEGL